MVNGKWKGDSPSLQDFPFTIHHLPFTSLRGYGGEIKKEK
jgi:hypothetical protein